MLENDTRLRHARHTNAMTTQLAEKLAGIGVLPPQANAVFAQLPFTVMAALHAKGRYFYEFVGGTAHFMCSWATTPEAVEALIADAAAARG